MADEITEGLEQASSSIEINTSNLNKAAGNLTSAVEQFNKSQQLFSQNLGKVFGDSNVGKGVQNSLRNIGVTGENVSRTMQGLQKSLDIRPGSNLEGFVTRMVGGFDSIGMSGKKMKDFVIANFDDIADAAKSGAVMLGLTATKDMIDRFGDSTGFNVIQKQIMDLDREVIRAGTAFGGSFREAQAATNSFRAELAHTIVDTRHTVEEVGKVRAGLKDAFGSSDQLTRLGNLSKAQDNIRSNLNLTNAALLLSTATGLSSEEVTKMMSKAHLELGENLEGSATMFGAIQLAADKSGMSFSKAAESIMNSTEALKMWGGTVGGVSPLFEAFTRTLGDGQKGLAVDLLKQYTDGLAGMGLEMRALIGLQAPGGAGRGAIGAGLEMEAALEQGPEGTERVSENLINTIKQFTGGQVVTREEAIKNPAMERAFLIQRQLLKQMIGGNDASNTKMLALLKDIDSHGLQVGGDTESKLGEMLGTAEKTQDATTTTIAKAVNDQKAALLKHGEKVLEKLGNILTAIGMDKVVSAFQQTSSRVATTGTISLDTIRDFGRFAGEGSEGPLAQFTEALKDKFGLSAEGNENMQEIIQGGMRGQQTVSEAVEKLTAGLSERRQAVLEGGTGGFGNRAQERIRAGQDIGMGAVAEEFKEIMSPLQSQIKELRGRGELERPEQAQLMALESGLENLKRMSARRTINLGTGDPGRLSLNEADNTQALPFRQPPDTGTAEARKKLNIDLDLNVNVIQDANGVKIQADIDQEKFANQLKLELPNLLR